ncbi:MAG TPA: coenzyme F420-0:L-glutamate ligase [Candidatus Limnocylindrales bacterium]|jgi:coenzyme F420-0:L-glutamate ligase/coenzyme F420-1:gamma-L-glutamate ligase
MPTITVVPLPPLPEVQPGDDLPALIAQAWWELAAAQNDLAPRRTDVLVVTQKIVSKAEGKLVDLTTITPRQEAIDFAKQWDRDARQVEVVLRESKEVLKFERGIVVSRTHHGFVCANAGVDASNTGQKDIVTLLPDDPDQSARDIRDRLPALLDLPSDQAPAVIISDSFGRPWRFGIMDVALGVAGIEPLIDLRDTPDADGRIMHSTIVAIADEIASAAELAAGKSSNQPVVLVRGVEFYNRGQSEPSVVREVVMPTEMDLFK